MAMDHNWINYSEVSKLFKILQGHKELSSPRQLSAEMVRELCLVEKKL